MSWKSEIRQFLRRKFAIDIVRYSVSGHYLARRAAILQNCKIDLVLDVGANAGQYGAQLRSIGYSGNIRSYEPLTSAYNRLCEVSHHDPKWDVYNFALGKRTEELTINVAGNSYSSSLKTMLPTHVQAAPESQYIDRERVLVKSLDEILADTPPQQSPILLKIDTQGSEVDVLDGAIRSLSDIDIIQLEMSLTPLYEGEQLIHETIKMLSEKGYDLVGIEPGFTDKSTARMLQVDGIFRKS